MALEKFIAEFKGGGEIKPYDRVVNLLGLLSSGISDLGESHRKYLLTKLKHHA